MRVFWQRRMVVLDRFLIELRQRSSETLSLSVVRTARLPAMCRCRSCFFTTKGTIIIIINSSINSICLNQLGITIASIGIGWLAEPALATLFLPLFDFIPWIDAKLATAHTISVTIANTGICKSKINKIICNFFIFCLIFIN